MGVIEMNDEDVKEIVQRIAVKFSGFGGGKISEINPLAAWMKDRPPLFALGVDIEQVVREVIKLQKGKRRTNGKRS